MLFITSSRDQMACPIFDLITAWDPPSLFFFYSLLTRHFFLSHARLLRVTVDYCADPDSAFEPGTCSGPGYLRGHQWLDSHLWYAVPL